MFESRLKSLINISLSVKNLYETVFEKGMGAEIETKKQTVNYNYMFDDESFSAKFPVKYQSLIIF